MKNKLVDTRNEIYRESPSSYWIISIFIVLVGIAVLALDLAVPGVHIISMPLIFFPLLFGCFCDLYALRLGQQINIPNTFRLASRYFKNPNMGCFRIIMNTLKALLVEFAAMFILVFILISVFARVHGDAFVDAMQAYMDAFTNEEEIDVITLLAKYPIFNDFLNANRTLGTICGALMFLFGVTYYSPGIYIRFNVNSPSGSFADQIFKTFLGDHRSEYRKDYWMLNWPLILMFFLGSILGPIVLMIFGLSSDFGVAFSLMFGMLTILPTMPYYFANSEALFIKYDKYFKQASNDFAKEMLDALKKRNDIPQEAKDKIEEFMKESNRIEDEDNKKDSDEESN